MKFYSEFKEERLYDNLKDLLESVRKNRGFDVEEYVSSKVEKINKYMKDYGLNACVVAISGGIDSAVVYALLNEAKRSNGSPISKIVPVFLPVYRSKGATNQEEARNRVEKLLKRYNEKMIEIDLSDVHRQLREVVNKSLGIKGEPWADGQLVSYLRTPTYYYVTSLLTQEGYKPIVCGTTNKDEGAYLGYFGKASDGMVDIQVISDIHKSEVYKVAEYLGVVRDILEAVPSGDMYDNRSDEEVFGAPYDFVELYLHYLNLDEKERNDFVGRLDEESLNQFKRLKKNLDDLHRYNKHKYLGCSPAVHLDIYESRFVGGWKYYVYGDDRK